MVLIIQKIIRRQRKYYRDKLLKAQASLGFNEESFEIYNYYDAKGINPITITYEGEIEKNKGEIKKYQKLLNLLKEITELEKKHNEFANKLSNTVDNNANKQELMNYLDDTAKKIKKKNDEFIKIAPESKLEDVITIAIKPEGSSKEDEMIDRYYNGSQEFKINSTKKFSFTPIPTQPYYVLFLKDSKSDNGKGEQTGEGPKSDGNRDNQSDDSSKENPVSNNGEDGNNKKLSIDNSKGSKEELSKKEDKINEDKKPEEDSSEEIDSESGNGKDKQSEASSESGVNGDKQQTPVIISEGETNKPEDSSEENSIIADNTSAEEKANLESLKEDNISKVFTPEEILSDVVSMISTPVTNVISERLSSDNSVIAADSNNNLVASTDNNSINLGNDNDSYEAWSKMHYNYSSNSSRSIHIFGLTLGGERGFKNNKYKIGLAYTFNSGNGSKYISNSISIYSSINDINIRDFRNNFANVILTYGRLNTNMVKNENKLVAIKRGYSTDLISLNTIFGHNIVLPNSNGIVTPTIGIRYDYINRNTYTNNALKHGELSMNVITPTVGVSYTNKVLNDNLTIKVGVNLGYGFNLNKKTEIVLKTTNNSHSETISYISTNALIGNFNFGLAYKVKKNIELSFDSNISYGINETFNAGFNFGGRYQF